MKDKGIMAEKSNKKIFFITYSMCGGGAERVMSTIANYLVKQEYDITFLLTHSDECVYELDPAIKIILRDNVQPKDGINQIKFIRHYYKKEPKALFISFLHSQNLYSLIANIGLNVRLLISERNNPDVKFSLKDKSSITTKGIKELTAKRCCSKAVFQTQGAMECYPKATQKKGAVIPNPLKTDLLDVYTGERQKNIVALGRLTSQKNYKLLIDAFFEFSKTHPDYVLQIYGKGELENTINKYTSFLNISGKVELCGFCTDVHERIIDAGMFVMSSNYEGLSNALLEAMAMGLPVISTDHPPGGARAYINSYENGILTPIKDVEEMAKAMSYMADNPDKAKEMGLKASLIRDELSTNSICEKWKSVFDEILK
jgi:glycosyltransferase involved in cell wall biosynthesis